MMLLVSDQIIYICISSLQLRTRRFKSEIFCNELSLQFFASKIIEGDVFRRGKLEDVENLVQNEDRLLALDITSTKFQYFFIREYQTLTQWYRVNFAL